MQIYLTSEMATDFRRMASRGLALSIVHEGIAISTSVSKAASYLVQVQALQRVLLRPAKHRQGIRKRGKEGMFCISTRKYAE